MLGHHAVARMRPGEARDWLLLETTGQWRGRCDGGPGWAHSCLLTRPRSAQAWHAAAHYLLMNTASENRVIADWELGLIS